MTAPLSGWVGAELSNHLSAEDLKPIEPFLHMEMWTSPAMCAQTWCMGNTTEKPTLRYQLEIDMKV
ncbi:hypothetical protein [Mechercharimyces sp. CAU 1602]|uniref:hypothetical protein n=1 Tax=Mechercharimyces sp. CAU 1602 TaxID=2973933 RepID=UPI0021612959|nr:hypothetical protein [Mechercharimyces sp. CAU 1602]MCS1351026.1 hypothetical protein [Mechercharimyces sp. CAU 1602]